MPFHSETQRGRESHLVCICLSSQKVTVPGSEGATDLLPYMHHLVHCTPKNHGLRAFAEQRADFYGGRKKGRRDRNREMWSQQPHLRLSLMFWSPCDNMASSSGHTALPLVFPGALHPCTGVGVRWWRLTLRKCRRKLTEVGRGDGVSRRCNPWCPPMSSHHQQHDPLSTSSPNPFPPWTLSFSQCWGRWFWFWFQHLSLPQAQVHSLGLSLISLCPSLWLPPSL